MNYKPLHRILPGKTIDMIPMIEEHTPAIVRLRNSLHVRQYFDEKGETTAESQMAFYRKYIQWPNDLYWCVRTKDDKIIGTNRLNEIDGYSGVKGSQIIDQNYMQRGPYALESEILLLGFAFEVLGLHIVHAIIRPDNTKVISLNKKMGFKLVGPHEMRGVIYDDYALASPDFQPHQFDDLFDYFARRESTQGKRA